MENQRSLLKNLDKISFPGVHAAYWSPGGAHGNTGVLNSLALRKEIDSPPLSSENHFDGLRQDEPECIKTR